MHRTLLGANAAGKVECWPIGLPVICGSNQPELGLANGDLGVVIGAGSERRLLFQVVDPDGQLRCAVCIQPVCGVWSRRLRSPSIGPRAVRPTG